MTLDVTHTKVSAVADGADPSAVRPSDWNAPHSITGLGDGVEAALAVAAGGAGGFAKALIVNIAESGDFGVIGDGATPDVAALQSLVDDVPDGSIIHVAPGLVIALDDELVISGRRSVRITSFNDARNFSASPTFRWIGANGGRILSMDASFACGIDGFTFRTADGITVDKAIDIDGYGPQISSVNSIRYNSFNFANQTNPNAKLVSISDTVLNNNENMDVSENFFYCSPSLARSAVAGIGIYNGASANAKHHRFYNNNISYATVGVYIASGSATIDHLGGGYNERDIYIFNPTEPIAINYLDTEGSKQALKTEASSGTVILDGCRFSNSNQTNTGGFLEIDGHVTVRGCKFENAPPSGGTLFEKRTANLRLTVQDTEMAYPTTWAETGLSTIGPGVDHSETLLAWGFKGVTGMPGKFVWQSGKPSGPDEMTGPYFNAPMLLATYTFAEVNAWGVATPTGLELNISNSNTAVWGATIAGGGANHVRARFNGTNWTVLGA